MPIQATGRQETIEEGITKPDAVPEATHTAPAKSKTASAPKAPPKPRAKKPPTRKPDPPPPSYDVLKSNRKRPLSKIPIGVLFTPGQVVSDAEYETAKRQRLGGKSERALQQEKDAAEGSDDLDILFDDVEPSMDENPKNIEVPMSSSADEVQIEPSSKAANVEADHGIEQRLSNVGALTPYRVETESDLAPSADKCQGHDPVQKQPVVHRHAPIESRNPALVEQGTDVGIASSASNAVDQEEQRRSFVKTTPVVTSPSTQKEGQSLLDLEVSLIRPTVIEPQTIKPQQTPPIARPTTGGKGISAATRTKWEAGPDPESKKEVVTTTPELVYEYFVSRCEWRVGNAEDNVMESILGPFHTVVEANTIARKEVTSPIKRDALDGNPGNR